MLNTKAETTPPNKPDGTRDRPYTLSDLVNQGKNGSQSYEIKSNEDLPKRFWDEFEKRSEIFLKTIKILLGFLLADLN